ncbi:MAG: manganese efflux pump MntP family protein [Oscillospiraceae bacterium]|nr:manganese efflux pump MntP family protein [Oscillospiraceae bacterium]
MGFWELFVLAVGLSMDAFAVSACKGLSVPRVRLRHALCAGLWFGGFQALMPLLGWLLGSRFQSAIESVDHWIAFLLLVLLGVNMLREGIGRQEEDAGDGFGWRQMLPMAAATSIDALAVGVTLAFLQVRILPAISFIGCTTFVLSAVGVWAGSFLGSRCQRGAKIAGGCILILMGVKILLEHLGVLTF